MPSRYRQTSQISFLCVLTLFDPIVHAVADTGLPRGLRVETPCCRLFEAGLAVRQLIAPRSSRYVLIGQAVQASVPTAALKRLREEIPM